MDEPTTGLHFDDIQRLLQVLNALVDKGNTVLVIEHNLDVAKSADWIVDMGPEGGAKGGEIVAEGTPEEVAKNKKDLAKLALGRRTVIAFYSSSCRTCQVVPPELQPFPPGLGLFLGDVGVQDSREDASALGFDGALLFRDSPSVFSRSFPMSSLPTILFVDEQSVLRVGMAGGRSRDRIRAKLDEFANGGL